MSAKSKVIIPNILTISRIILTPIIILLLVSKHYTIALFFTIIACLTDFFDGYLARKFKTTTAYGAKLDALSDKVFVIGLILSLMFKFKILVFIMILEILIGLFNYYVYKNNKETKTLMIGKIKTNLLFGTICFCFLALKFKGINFLISGLGLATINIQILTLISYIVNYYDLLKNEELEKAIVKDKETTRSKEFDLKELEKENKKEEKKELSDTKVLKHIRDIFLEKD